MLEAFDAQKRAARQRIANEKRERERLELIAYGMGGVTSDDGSSKFSPEEILYHRSKNHEALSNHSRMKPRQL